MSIAALGPLTVADAHFLLPQRVEAMRTGYWAEGISSFWTFVVLRGWRRPLMVAATLIFLGILLEVLQCLDPIHSPNPLAALSSVTGVLAALPIAIFLIPQEREAVAAIDRASARQH